MDQIAEIVGQAIEGSDLGGHDVSNFNQRARSLGLRDMALTVIGQCNNPRAPPQVDVLDYCHGHRRY
jgi:hypothetical protein